MSYGQTQGFEPNDGGGGSGGSGGHRPQPPLPPQEHRSRSKPLAVGLSLLVVLALVGAGGFFFLRNWTPGTDAAKAEASASPSDTQTAQSTPTPTASVERTPTPSDTPASSAPGFAPVELKLDDATLKQACKGRYGVKFWGKGASPIAGTPYVGGFGCELKPAEATGYVDFLVPPGATRLTVVVGQRDDSQETSAIVRFEVRDVVTGNALVSHDLPFGTSKPVDIPVEDLPRIRLQVSWLKLDASSSGTKGVQAAWAEPTFR